MPPKLVVCSICHTEVLKAHTLARKDGSRACRSHEGVTEESASVLAAQKVVRDKQIQEQSGARRFGNTDHYVNADKALREANRWREHLENHCWVCDVEGISLQEFYVEALITLKRLHLRGEFNFLTMHQDVARLNPGLTVIVTLPHDEASMRHVLPQIRDYKIRDVLPLIRFVRLCMSCVTKFDLQKAVENLHPTPTFEQIQSMVGVTTLIDPLLTELAEKKERQS